jgi:hypothetical protein
MTETGKDLRNFWLRFSLYFVEPSWSENDPLNSLAFHRWLPDGKQDGLKIPVSSPGAGLEIWCERLGVVDESGFLRYDPSKQEVDTTSLPYAGKRWSIPGRFSGGCSFRVLDNKI